MIKTPGSRGTGYLTLVRALKIESWATFLFVLLIGSALASVPYYLSSLGYTSLSENQPGLMAIRECSYQCFALLCQQGNLLF